MTETSVVRVFLTRLSLQRFDHYCFILTLILQQTSLCYRWQSLFFFLNVHKTYYVVSQSMIKQTLNPPLKFLKTSFLTPQKNSLPSIQRQQFHNPFIILRCLLQQILRSWIYLRSDLKFTLLLSHYYPCRTPNGSRFDFHAEKLNLLLLLYLHVTLGRLRTTSNHVSSHQKSFSVQSILLFWLQQRKSFSKIRIDIRARIFDSIDTPSLNSTFLKLNQLSELFSGYFRQNKLSNFLDILFTVSILKIVLGFHILLSCLSQIISHPLQHFYKQNIQDSLQKISQNMNQGRKWNSPNDYIQCRKCNQEHLSKFDCEQVLCRYCHQVHRLNEFVKGMCPIVYRRVKEAQGSDVTCPHCLGYKTYKTTKIASIVQIQENQRQIQDRSRQKIVKKSAQKQKGRQWIVSSRIKTCRLCQGKGKMTRFIPCCYCGCKKCDYQGIIVHPSWQKHEKSIDYKHQQIIYEQNKVL